MLQKSKGFTLLWRQLCCWRILGVEIVVIFKNSLQGNYYLIYHDVVGSSGHEILLKNKYLTLFVHFPRKSWLKNLIINTNFWNFGGFSVVSFLNLFETNVVNPLFWPEAGRNPKFLKCILSCSELSGKSPQLWFSKFSLYLWDIFQLFVIFQK